MENGVINEVTTARMKDLFLAECETQRQLINKAVDSHQKRLDEYLKISTQLNKNVQKLEVATMAPICDVAYFCDAYFVHTNEVLINLGDDTLAECSVHSAQKILQRRMNELKKTILDGNESIKMIDEKVQYTNNLFNKDEKGVIEISEAFDETAEKEFYEKRKERNKKKTFDKSAEDNAHKLAMSRLDELEKLEAENKELGTVTITKQESEEMEEEEEEEEFEHVGKENIEKLLQMPGVSEKEMTRLLEFLEVCDQTSSEEDEDEENDLDSDDFEDAEEISEISEVPPQNVAPKFEKAVKIEELKTKPKKKTSGVRFSEELEKVKEFRKEDLVQTKKHSNEIETETKSILTRKDPTPIRPDYNPNETKEMATMSTGTFPGMIVEKNAIKFIECEPSTSKEPELKEEKKKMSKFRQRRSMGH